MSFVGHYNLIIYFAPMYVCIYVYNHRETPSLFSESGPSNAMAFVSLTISSITHLRHRAGSRAQAVLSGCEARARGGGEGGGSRLIHTSLFPSFLLNSSPPSHLHNCWSSISITFNYFFLITLSSSLPSTTGQVVNGTGRMGSFDFMSDITTLCAASLVDLGVGGLPVFSFVPFLSRLLYSCYYGRLGSCYYAGSSIASCEQLSYYSGLRPERRGNTYAQGKERGEGGLSSLI